jgi:hypothetical protein
VDAPADPGFSYDVTKVDSQHFYVGVRLLDTTGSGDGPVSVVVLPDVVKDSVGRSNSGSNVATVVWGVTMPGSITITESPGSGQPAMAPRTSCRSRCWSALQLIWGV